ncbi:MAG: hypothetical protein BRD49_04335 [Bacteroidetes bacterium SW_10_40_5]|nr:MAG: hypothetical protein BRD49_04335 [Bacteroidetes bacterium SW_10_40_5]
MWRSSSHAYLQTSSRHANSEPSNILENGFPVIYAVRAVSAAFSVPKFRRILKRFVRVSDTLFQVLEQLFYELIVNDYVSVKRTQETKKINEYQCEKYIIKANKANSQVWVTKELDFNFNRLFNALNDHPRNQEVTSKIPFMDQLSLNGFPVASLLQHKGNHDWVRTKLTEIKEKQLPQSKFDLSGYYVQDGNNNSFIQEKN